MTMIEIMKKLGIKKAEWKEIEYGNVQLTKDKYKRFDKRTDRKYMKEFSNHEEYGFFNEANHDKLIANGWKPVCDSDYQPVRRYKEYYVDKQGKIYRLVTDMRGFNPVFSFEQMMIGDKIVDKKDYLR